MNRNDPPWLCFAHGGSTGWEAICVDFDIAVQGESFDKVKADLSEAVKLYVEAASQESPEARAKLLERRAPWRVVLGLTTKLIAFNLFRGRNREEQASFPVACPA